MDKRLEILGQEGLPFIEIERFKKLRSELEKQSPPEKTTTFESWAVQIEKELKAEIENMVGSIVQTANQNVADAFTEEGLLQQTRRLLKSEVAKFAIPFFQLHVLPSIKGRLEDVVFSRSMSTFDLRFEDVDRNIQTWERKIYKPFTPALINLDPHYPVDRCEQADKKYFDAWLTEFLKTKPIFFEPRERHTEKLVECYQKVYLVEFQREEDEKLKVQAPSVEQPRPVIQDDYRIPGSELTKFFNRQEDAPMRNSRIYKGGNK